MTEHWRAFGCLFFLLHQDRLLWLLNAPIIGRWFRRVLRISGKASEVGRRKIFRILPNAIFWWDGDNQVAEFRTHAKFSKRVYYSFAPLWWAMHFWDWAFADRWVPQLSFGFSTLTAYPNADADDPKTTCDGHVAQEYAGGSGATWATIRAAAGNTSDHTTTGSHLYYIVADTVSDRWITLRRSIFLFDTSGIVSGAEITAATLSFYGYSKNSNLAGSPAVNVYSSAPASDTALEAGDFDSLGTTRLCDTDITYAGFNITGYNSFAFNAAGLAAITKGGISKFGTRNRNFDADGATPTWASGALSRVNANHADQADTTNDPRLSVVYKENAGGVLTARSDMYPESTSVDGSVRHTGTNLTWATIRDGAGTSTFQTGGAFRILAGTNSDRWNQLYRAIILFDTSDLGIDATILSAVLTLYSTGKVDTGNRSPSVNIYSSNPASNTALAAGDFDSLGTTPLSTTKAWGDIPTGDFVDFTLNNDGLAAISKTGITKLGIRNANFDVANTPPTWASGQDMYWSIAWAEASDVPLRGPKLVVTYSLPSTGIATHVFNYLRQMGA